MGSARHASGAGFTLVEVMVALVVIAVGMLGIAGLYLEGLRASRTSIYVTAATTLAGDLAERIRSNPAGGAAYGGNGPGADNGCVNGPVNCAPAPLAADDWFHWLQDVQSRLPGGVAANVAVTAGVAGTHYQITLSWPEIGRPDPASYTMAVDLP
jgi:type IV pilus assembly protein PilV